LRERVDVGIGGLRGALSERGDGTTHIDSNVNAQLVVLDVLIKIDVEFLCAVVTNNQSILGQFLEEAFGRCALDVEIEGLDGDEERRE
jgi:hypothetical protein